MEAFPQAKFVLTISDPERWYDSYVKLLVSMRSVIDPLIDAVQLDTWAQTEAGETCSAGVYWGCDVANVSASEASKKQCMDSYKRHNERVQEVIPADRLLVFNFSDGWAPLAHFLGKPIPDAEFPHVDLPGLFYEKILPEVLSSDSTASTV